MFPINWDGPFRKKDGTMGTMEEAGGGGSDLPEYDSGDSGKVLGVDDEGLLEWKELPGGTKIYYKEFSSGASSDKVIAAFDGTTAVDSGIHIARLNGEVTVNGYTAISAVAIDVLSGYAFGVLFETFTQSPGYLRSYLSYAIGSKAINNNNLRVKVFYVKNEYLEELT